MSRRLASVLAAAVVLVGCYHGTVETGLTPSNQTINKSFASGWLFGLVPPSTVQAGSQCPSGVARVETQLSFVNQLVAWLTAYIYTPMQITVTCAQGGRSSLEPGSAEIPVGPHATPEAVDQGLVRAAEQSLRTRAPVYVVY